MKRCIKTVLVLLMMPIFFDTAAYADYISAESAVLIECSQKRVIFEKNAYQNLPMASTTKIMTALCAIENSDIDTLITVDDSAVGTEGSSIYLGYKEKITVRELLYGLMLNSGNDASVAIACAVCDNVNDFVALMNMTAKRLGAENTHFTNPNGLYEEEHYTTAYDLAVISAYAMTNDIFKQIVSTVDKTISNGDKPYKRALHNHNKLLGMYDGCIGIKTGYTKKCGRCLVSCAERDGIRLICVTLNAPDDWNDHKSLLDHGFGVLSTRTMYKQGDAVTEVAVSGAREKKCALICRDEVKYVTFTGDKEDYKMCFDIPSTLDAPLKKGEITGYAYLVSNNKIIARTALLAGSDIERYEPKKQSVFAKLMSAFIGQCK